MLGRRCKITDIFGIPVRLVRNAGYRRAGAISPEAGAPTIKIMRLRADRGIRWIVGAVVMAAVQV